VLKKKETEEERRERERQEKENQVTLEDFLEKRVRKHAKPKRLELGPNTTPVTHASFLEWKKQRVEKQVDLDLKNRETKQEAVKKMKAGMKTGIKVSGKDMFDFNPDWANNDDDDIDDSIDIFKNNINEDVEMENLSREASLMTVDSIDPRVE
jgi:hypothetical protein